MKRADFREILRLNEALSRFDGLLAAQTLREIAATHGAAPRQRRVSVVMAMFMTGAIGKPQLQAASEIESVFGAITSACAGRTACYAPERGQSAEELPVTLRDAYTKRYTPWRAAMGVVGVAASATVADLVILAVVDNVGCQQLADRYRIGRLRAHAVVQDGLAEYVKIAGW